MKCRTPPLDRAARLWAGVFSLVSTGGTRTPSPVRLAHPGSHWYPHYAQRLVKFDISNNGQDFSDSGLTYLHEAPATVESVSPPPRGVSVGNEESRPGLFITGSNFVNSTTLRCRVGEDVLPATYLLPSLVMCFPPPVEPGTGQTSRCRQ